MRAVTVNRHGELAAVREIERPTAHEGEALVAVHVAGVDPTDLAIRDGEFGERSMPLVLGRDFAGSVSMTNTAEYDFGDRVFGLSPQYGSFGEYTVCAGGGFTARTPAGLSDGCAAALPTAGLTALRALDALRVSARTALVIHGASSFVGTLALQLALLRGALVVATVDGTGPDVRALGADGIVDVRDGDFVEEIRACVPEKADAVLDLGNASGGHALHMARFMREGASIVSACGDAVIGEFEADGFRAMKLDHMILTTSPPGALLYLASLVAAGRLVFQVDRELTLEETPIVLRETAAAIAARKAIIRISNLPTTEKRCPLIIPKTMPVRRPPRA